MLQVLKGETIARCRRRGSWGYSGGIRRKGGDVHGSKTFFQLNKVWVLLIHRFLREPGETVCISFVLHLA